MKHFDDFHEDQFDFHSYCVRKVTLRAYTDVLKFEDNLWGEEYYFMAAEGSIRIYLNLHDNPDIGKEDNEPDYSKMTAAEKKKAKAVARKKKAQAEKEAEKRKQESDSAENGGGLLTAQSSKGKQSPVEEDAAGKELLMKDPLEEAKKYSAILSKHCPKRLGTWVLQYDVAIRRKKPLLAIQALIKMKNLDPNSDVYIVRLVDFAVKLENFVMVDAVNAVVTEESTKLLDGKPVSSFVTDLANKARVDPSTSLPVRVAIAQSLVLSKTETAASASSLIVEGGISSRGVTVESCRFALDTLKGFGTDASEPTTQWISLVNDRFPLVKEFN